MTWDLRRVTAAARTTFGILLLEPRPLRDGGLNYAYRITVQMLLSRNAVSCDLESAPTRVASTLPFLKSISVGMPRMPNFAGVLWFSSTLIFAILRRPSYSLATSSRIGAIDLHGPHHSAQ